MRLVDIGSLKDAFPLTITDLKKNVFKATQQGVKILQEMWIPSCVKLISDRRDEIEVCMPDVEVILSSQGSMAELKVALAPMSSLCNYSTSVKISQENNAQIAFLNPWVPKIFSWGGISP